MSQETESLLEKALIDHLTDEGFLGDGELLVEWCVVAASIPEERTDEMDSTILVTAPRSSLQHSIRGMLFTYLHEKGDPHS